MFSSEPNMKSARARASSVFPTPVGPRNMNTPIGRRGSLSPARARRTAFASATIGFFLTNDPLVQILFHAQQPLGLLGRDLDQRNARPHRDHLSDVLGQHVGGISLALLVQIFFQVGNSLRQLQLTVTQVSRVLVLLLIDRLLFLLANPLETNGRLFERRRRVRAANPHA